jgi:hypothetical protein
MKVISVWLCFVTLLITSHRLPAPIIEEAVSTPAAPPEKSRPHRKKETESARKETPNEQKVSPFAGTWSGTVNGQYRSAEGKEGATIPMNCVIQISNDGKTVSGKWHALGPEVQQSPAISNGSTLTWSSQSPTPSAPLSTTSNCVLQMTSSTSATFTCNMTIITGFLKGATYILKAAPTKR